jgi:predicted dehydrogenase
LNVAIVGLGYWGPNLFRNFSATPDWNVSAVVDVDEGRIAKVLKGRAGTRGLTSIAEVLDDPSIDAIVVATPPVTHCDIVRSALLAGKHVLVEKPLCLESKASEELCRLAEERGLVLMVDHTFLYTGAVEKLKDLIDSGTLGTIYYLDSIRINLGLFQLNASVVEDLAPHDISIFNYLLGETPTAVSAIGSSHFREMQSAPDIAYMTLRYPSGVSAHIHMSWISPVKVRKTMIAGSAKMAIWDDVEPSEKVRVYDRGVDVSLDVESRSKLLVSYRMGDIMIPALDGTEALAKVARAFAHTIRTGEPSRCMGTDGLRVVEVLEAAQASIKRDGAFITLPSSKAAVTTQP